MLAYTTALFCTISHPLRSTARKKPRQRCASPTTTSSCNAKNENLKKYLKKRRKQHLSFRLQHTKILTTSDMQLEKKNGGVRQPRDTPASHTDLDKDRKQQSAATAFSASFEGAIPKYAHQCRIFRQESSNNCIRFWTAGKQLALCIVTN